jgi:spore maturation protein B
LAAIIGAAAWQRVKVYEAFVEGAKEGFETGVRIIPYLVAILVAIGMFRASGAMEVMTSLLGVITEPVGLPAEVVPMALVRPLSGSGALAMVAELNAAHGPDSYIGYLASVLNGSTETTFYVLAVYFGAVGISRPRHAVAAGLSADLVGVVAAVVVCQAFFGHLA